jgi:hypothetical protein
MHHFFPFNRCDDGEFLSCQAMKSVWQADLFRSGALRMMGKILPALQCNVFLALPAAVPRPASPVVTTVVAPRQGRLTHYNFGRAFFQDALLKSIHTRLVHIVNEKRNYGTNRTNGIDGKYPPFPFVLFVP